jgi:hypothetical protein
MRYEMIGQPHDRGTRRTATHRADVRRNRQRRRGANDLFTVVLSINLGLINLFPIPMLDGGHLLMYAIEAVRGCPLTERSQEVAFRFGLVW